MPQATDEQRALMEKWFGDPVSDSGPLNFIIMRGYDVRNGGVIHPPVNSHRVSYEEGACIDFLCDEWDFDFAGTIRPDYA